MRRVVERVAASALALGLLAQAAQAEELRSGIPEAHAIDVLGVSPGMTPDQALAALKRAFPGVKPGVNERRHRGTKKPFVDSIVARKNTWPREEVLVRFTGHWSGNRAYTIKRKVSYKRGDNPSFTETLGNVVAKYGVPSLAISGGVGLTYSFTPDLIRVLPEQQIAAAITAQEDIRYTTISKAGREAQDANRLLRRCVEAVPKVQSTQFFDILKARGGTPGCTAGMDITLRRSADLLSSMEVLVTDFQLLVDGIKIDRKRNEQHKPVPKATGAAPKL